ncbi:hypothetical protein BH10CYA1_BH10CYA1_50460 [soil metagenome]
MTIIIVAFHILLIIGIVLMVQAIGEKKKLKALAASKILETKPEVLPELLSPIPTEPVSEQKQAVQMVHHGLENVIRHLTTIEGHRPEMELSEINTNLMANGGTNEIT